MSLVEQKKKIFWKKTYLSLETCLCLEPPLLLPLLLLVDPAIGSRGRREREREDGTCDEGFLKSTSIMWFVEGGLKGLVTKQKTQLCDRLMTSSPTMTMNFSTMMSIVSTTAAAAAATTTTSLTMTMMATMNENNGLNRQMNGDGRAKNRWK